jgi:DtxR family Mn-dependent transcriptional regulator
MQFKWRKIKPHCHIRGPFCHREAETRDRAIDELLEFIWNLRENGVSNLADLHSEASDPEARNILSYMEQEGLFAREGDKVYLKEKGEEKAREIIRRHRLTERLLMEIFELSEEEAEKEACKLEHILSPEVTDSVCTFLGHPPVCPHGKPIPPGKCCTAPEKSVKPLVMPLNDLDPGAEGRIVFISTNFPARLDKLSALGVAPGSIIKLRQKKPSPIIQVGETTVAVDPEIVHDIYVKAV